MGLHAADDGSDSTEFSVENFLRELEDGNCFQRIRAFGEKPGISMSRETPKGDCIKCTKKRECSRVSTEDLIESAGKPSCFGSSPHMIDRELTCGYEACDLSKGCEIAHDDLFFRHDVDVISSARDAAHLTRMGKEAPLSPAPPLAPVGSEIVLVESPASVLVSRPIDEVSPPTTLVPTAEFHSGACAIGSTGLFDEHNLLVHRKAFSCITVDELKRTVSSLSEGFQLDGSSRHEYSILREMFIAASMELNERWHVAPRFHARKRLSIPVVAEQQTYARDLQLIDLHWLSCYGNPLPTSEWEGIFDTTGLNFQRAWEYACRKVTPHFKAEFLGLGGVEEHCVAMIQKKTTQATWKTLHERRGATIAMIKRAMDGPSIRRTDDPAYLYDVFRALHAMEGSKSRALILLGYMGHQKPSTTSFARQSKWLEKIGLPSAKEVASTHLS